MMNMQPSDMKRLRKAMGLTQGQLAIVLGMVVQSIGRMERGEMAIEPRTAMSMLWLESQHSLLPKL